MISKLSKKLRLDIKCRTQHDEIVGTIIPKGHQFKGNTCALQQIVVNVKDNDDDSFIWGTTPDMTDLESKSRDHKVLRLYNSYFSGCVDQFYFIDKNHMKIRVGESTSTPKYMVNFLNRIGEELSQGKNKVEVELVVRGSLFKDEKNDTKMVYREFYSDAESVFTRKGLDFSGNITNMNCLSILKEFNKFIKKGIRYSTWTDHVNDETLLSCMDIIEYEDGSSNATVEMSIDTVRKMHNHIYSE